MDADGIVVGGGLAGLVAATELIEAGKHVILLDQEPAQSLGGQAFWSFGGLFFVDSPEQRRMRIRDSYELALQDWLGSAGFDREEDLWPRKWAEAYVAFAAGEKRAWLHAKGLRWFPSGWPSAAATLPPSTATPCRASTSPGARPRHHRAVRGRARGREAGARPASAIASTASPPRPASSTACAATSWERAR
jgi:glycine/D-amino acid oxidase-like deaminating enzyme